MNLETRFINAIKEYDKRGFGTEGNRKGAFYHTDFHAVKALSTDENGTIQLYTTMVNAMKGAFILGYRAAKREERKKRKQKRAPVQIV